MAITPQDGTPIKDVDQPGYRYARALVESAVSASESRVKTFTTNWNKFLGRYQWTSPSSLDLDKWMFKGFVNWIFSTIKTKAAMILGAQTDVFVEALDDQSTYMDRLLVKSAMEDLLEAVRFQAIQRDVYISGSVTGIGAAMWQYKPDPITGEMKLIAKPVRSDEFWCDPSADSITSPDCRYVVWGPELDMSAVREMFPSKADNVKATGAPVSKASPLTYSTSSDANLIYGTGGEFQVDPKNRILSRKARVYFVWIRDEDSLITDLQTTVLQPAVMGWDCSNCGNMYDDDVLDGDPTCPTCGEPLSEAPITPAVTQQDRIVRRKYPYGRLIVYSGTTLLYDGENPCELENCFPFAVYHHDRVPGDFYGVNDVNLLDSLQDAQNRTIGSIIDGVRLTLHPVFEYPVNAKSYTKMGVCPGERHPVPDHLVGRSAYKTPSTNIAIAELALKAVEQQFLILSGLNVPSTGGQSSPPISATEAEISQQSLSDRMKEHSRGFSQFCSDFAEIGRQLGKQFLATPKRVAVTYPDSTVRELEVEWQKLPDVRVHVMISPEKTIADKQLGQNITMGLPTGILQSPAAELWLESIGAPPNRIRELMERQALDQELSQRPPGPPQLSLVPPPPQQGGPIGPAAQQSQ